MSTKEDVLKLDIFVSFLGVHGEDELVVLSGDSRNRLDTLTKLIFSDIMKKSQRGLGEGITIHLNFLFKPSTIADELLMIQHEKSGYDISDIGAFASSMTDDKYPTEFMINVFCDEHTDFEEVARHLGHEMVHVRQMYDGSLYRLDSDTTEWFGDNYSESEMNYWDSPWEHEAYGMGYCTACKCVEWTQDEYGSEWVYDTLHKILKEEGTVCKDDN